MSETPKPPTDETQITSDETHSDESSTSEVENLLDLFELESFRNDFLHVQTQWERESLKNVDTQINKEAKSVVDNIYQ